MTHPTPLVWSAAHYRVFSRQFWTFDWFIAELQRPDTDMTGPMQQLVTVAGLVVASRVEL